MDHRARAAGNTPDHEALIGEAPTVSGFLYATGFCGHGFLRGPAVGEVTGTFASGARPSRTPAR